MLIDRHASRQNRADGRPGPEMDRTELRVQSFLKLGYFIDYEADLRPIDFSRIDRIPYADVPRAALVDMGCARLRETFSALFDPNAEHVVPISGGLDSRLILGALLELMPAEKLHTYTFGIPGSYDYDLGCLIAKHAGTKHLALPLDGISYHKSEMLDFARRSQRQAMLFYHPPVRELEQRYANAQIWSGYVGDAVVGSHLHTPPSASLLEAKRVHIKNRSMVRSMRLHRCPDEDLLPFVGGGDLDPAILTFDEQVLFAEAVRKFTAPLVLFDGFRYLTPLINTPWMDFSFSVPNRFREHEALMISIARKAFPRLFALPTKNSLGLGLGTPAPIIRTLTLVNKARKLLHQFAPRSVRYPHILYNDYNEAIRSSPDVRKIVLDALQDLRRRGITPWLDLDAIVKRHMRRLRNHGDALIVLASLELVHQAGTAQG